MATPDVRVRFSAEGAQQVVGQINSVQKAAQQAQRRLSQASAALGVGFGVAAFVGIIKGSIDAGSALAGFAEKSKLGAKAASELAFAANKADVSAESLASGVKNMQLVLADAGTGSDKAADALAAVGLSIDRLRGLRPDEQFELIADAINQIENPALRVRRAVDIFGRSGADLLPLFKDGAAGIRAAREEAIALGKSIDAIDLKRLAEADDALKRMKASSTSAAQSLTVVLAPAIIQVADAIRTLTGGATEIEKIEEKLSKLREFSGEGGMLNFGFDDRLGIIAFRGAIEKRIAELERQRSALITGASEGRRGIRGGRGRGLDLPSTGGLSDSAAESATTAGKTLKVKDQTAEIERLFDQQAQVLADARDVAIVTGREVLELAGRERDAKIQTLDDEITRRKIVLAIAGQLGAQEKAQLDRFRELSVARIDFESLKEQGEAALDALDRERTRIQQNVELGLTSQIAGQNELIRIERDRLIVLEQLAAAMLKAAQATGDQGLMAQAEQFSQAVAGVRVSLKQATDIWLEIQQGTAEALAGGFESFFENVITGTQSVTSAFRSMASSVVREIQKILAQQMAMKALGFLSGFAGLGFLGGAVKAADGGLIRGPGSDRSDNIPALLSPGEYVVRAAAVRALGVGVLEQINRGLRLPRVQIPGQFVRRFADGGFVGAAAPAAAGGGTKIVNVLDPSLVTEALTTQAGERAIVNVIKRNPGLIRKALG